MEHLHLFLTLVLGATACPTLQKSCSKCSVTDVYNTYSDKLMVDYDIPMDDILLVSATDAVSEHIGEDGCLQAIFHCPPRTYGAFWQTGLYSERSTAPQFNTHLRNVTCSEDSKWMVLEKYLGFLELSNVFCYHTGMDKLFCTVGSVEQIIRHAPLYDFSPLGKMATFYHSRKEQRFFLLSNNEKGEGIFRYQKYVRAAKYFEDTVEATDGGSQFAVFKTGQQNQLSQFRPTLVPYKLEHMKAACTTLLSQAIGFIDPDAISEWESFSTDLQLQPTGRFDDQMAGIEQALDQSDPPVVTCNEDTLQSFLQKHNLKKRDNYKKVRRGK